MNKEQQTKTILIGHLLLKYAMNIDSNLLSSDFETDYDNILSGRCSH